jgi:predicted GIY-YIG superfamily endonuclease
MFWVYILENTRGTFYIGQTADLDARLKHHNQSDCFDGHFTRKNGPWRLVWSEEHQTRRPATQKESDKSPGPMFDTLQFVVMVQRLQVKRNLSFTLPLMNLDDKLKCIEHALLPLVHFCSGSTTECQRQGFLI